MIHHYEQLPEEDEDRDEHDTHKSFSLLHGHPEIDDEVSLSPPIQVPQGTLLNLKF